MDSPRIKGVETVSLAVRDLDLAFDFYRNVLGLHPIARWRHGAQFDLGDARLELLLTSDREAGPREPYTHFGLVVVGEHFGTISERIIDSGAQIWHDNPRDQTALYFADPDGHRIEVLVSDQDSLGSIPLEAWDLIRVEDDELEFFDA